MIVLEFVIVYDVFPQCSLLVSGILPQLAIEFCIAYIIQINSPNTYPLGNDLIRQSLFLKCFFLLQIPALKIS